MVDTNPECFACKRTEEECARRGGCCIKCTHTFDGGETRGFVCIDCGRPSRAARNGPLPERCVVCYARRNGGTRRVGPTIEQAAESKPSKTERRHPRLAPETSLHDLPHRHPDLALRLSGEYAWYVATTGTAHLFLADGQMSHCGGVREAPIGESVAEWYRHCQRCEFAMPWEIDRDARAFRERAG